MNKTLHKGSLFLTLLGSTSTLLCCAIPAILILLGAGSAVATLVGAFPQLVWLSDHKVWLFVFGAVMLALSRYLSRAQTFSCPTDPTLAENCRQTKQWTSTLWWVSALLYLIGFGVSYLAPLFLS